MQPHRPSGPVRACAAFLCLACLAATPPAAAATSFKVEELYSNLDGSYQYIRLRESAGRDDEHRIGGIVITVIGGGTTKSVTIPRDLWWPTTAGQPVHISTGWGPPVCCGIPGVDNDWSYSWFDDGYQGGDGSGFAPADYMILPERFLPVGGGTIGIGDADTITFPALPLDGAHAIDRTGRVVRAEVRSFVRSINPFNVTFPEPQVREVVPSEIYVREYHHAGLDHYFVTAHAAEIDAIERGVLAGWTLNAYGGFTVYAAAGPVSITRLQPQVIEVDGQPVCRYYLPPPLGDTHFFSASPAECAAVAAQLPGAIPESASAFVVQPADPVTGACAADDLDNDNYSHKVYRLWNGLAQANHRYTMSRDDRAALIARGWRPEGHGPEGVAFCSLQPEWYNWPWDW